MALRAADTTAETLTPKLTAWDRKVLATLPAWDLWGPDDRISKDRPVYRDIYEIGRDLRTLDLLDVKRTLDGLVNFHYAWTNGYGHRQRWAAAPSRSSHEEGRS